MHGIQRRHEDRIAFERLVEPRLVDGEARDRGIGERSRRVREQLDALQQVHAITGSMTFSWKLPDWPGDRDRRVVADDLRRDHRDRFRDHRDSPCPA